MLGDALVVNAVVHPFNFSAANIRAGDGAAHFVNALWHKHLALSADGFALQREEFFADFDGDALVASLFEESPIDFAVLHALPTLGFFRGPLCDLEGLRRLRNAAPERYLLYGAIEPYDLNRALDSLDEQVESVGIDGVKLYPASYFEGNTIGWRMDDPQIAFPIFQRIHDHGIRNVAVHKAIPLGRTRVEPFRVEDVEGAAIAFPDMNFHVVHAGAAFVEETAMLMGRFPNVYANLEITFSYIVPHPRVFAEAIGPLLRAAPDRVVFGDGCNMVHPRPALEAFGTFEMPVDLVRDRGYPELDEALRAKILGGNIARAHGLDLAQLRKDLDAKPFEPESAAPPWSRLRDRRVETAGVR